MIKQFRPGALRRRIGFVGLATVMLGVAVVSQAAVDNHANKDSAPDIAYNSTINPQYPASAIKNHEHGLVMLKVLVGKDGKPQTIDVAPPSDASPDLVKAARDAASQWHFTPKLDNGKPVAAYTLVPVQFAMTIQPASPPPLPPLPPTRPAPPAPPAPPAAPAAPSPPLAQASPNI